MRDLLTAFGLLCLWCVGTAVAAVVITGIFALVWFPLVNALFKYNDWLHSKF